jgi:sec-independent protein translocase protein TatC
MSGALDEDTAQTLASGRQTIGSMLSSAQDNLKRVFLVFVVGWLGTFYLMRVFIWDRLKQDLVFRRLPEDTTTQIVATDPFQVILLQIKIGLIVGILAAIPALLYYSRDSLKRRGIWPDAHIPLWKKAGFVSVITGLFLMGLSYAYFFFFPFMFEFLATNAENAGFKPTWSIVKWTEFIVFLALSFGLAAQLPLAMAASARTGVIPYETFRDKWRYAVVGIAIFGAMFSPPDPFTQVMWGGPLVVLYFISLGITKLVVLSKRAGESVPTRTVVSERWNVLAGAAVLTVAAVYAFMYEGGTAAVNDLLAGIGSGYRFTPGPELDVFGLDPTVVVAVIAAGYAAIVVGILLFYLRVQKLEEVARQQRQEANSSQQSQQQTDADPGESAEIDVAGMSAKALDAAPAEAFAGLSEQQALQLAQNAVDNENPAKAQTILDRFDEAQEIDFDADEDEAEQEEEDENIVTSTAAGMLDPFTEGDTDEDDIGGYYYDFRFILDSLTSKAIWIVGVFMFVLAGSFIALFQGGIGVARDFFLQNMPAETVEEPEIVVLHPVEALIFMLKFSTVLAALSILPITLYFAWPSIETRFGVTGDQNVLLVWGGTMLVTLVGGTILGFVYIAPTIISLLALDVVNANMIIAYRISSFGWLVIFLTVGVGALAMVPATMVLFHHGRIVSYRRMQQSWRGVVLALFAAAGFFSPDSLFSMFLVAIPASLAYLFGLGVVRVYIWLFS